MDSAFTQPLVIVQEGKMSNLVSGVFGDRHGESPLPSEVAQANATFITRACNSHEALKAALTEAAKHVPKDAFYWSKGDYGQRLYVHELITAALKSAE